MKNTNLKKTSSVSINDGVVSGEIVLFSSLSTLSLI